MMSLCYWILRYAAFSCVLYAIAVDATVSKCEVLNLSLLYTQEDAPTDVSGFLPSITERIKTLYEGVVTVEIKRTGGDFREHVGEHFVQCYVKRLASGSSTTGSTGLDVFFDNEGRNVFTQCFHVPITIIATKEDARDGFPPCAGKHQIYTVSAGKEPTCTCKPGFVFHEKFGCVDEFPPALRLKSDSNGDPIVRLKQGDAYNDLGIEIQDENAEEYRRSLKTTYSKPLLSGCLTEIGEFQVNYTIATPWTSPPFVRITRRVIIEDIDECTLDPKIVALKCPHLVHRCDTAKGATCVNTIGSYTCMCPDFISGDGFEENLSFGPHVTPEGFQGGTSCHDTIPPVISLRGPNPKVFRVSGITGKKTSMHYEGEIKEVILETAGAVLCANSIDRIPNATDCIVAYDETNMGRVDLAEAVVVGEPIMKSALHWSVPYNVKDAAGNPAKTMWRDVVVEEVDIANCKLKEEIREELKEEIREELFNTQEIKDLSCKINESSWQEIRNESSKSRAFDEEDFIGQTVPWWQMWSPTAIALLMLVWFTTLVFITLAYPRRYYDDVHNKWTLMNAVADYHNPTGNGDSSSFPTSPRPTAHMNDHSSSQTMNGVNCPVSATRRGKFTDMYQSPMQRGGDVRNPTTRYNYYYSPDWDKDL